MRKHLFIAVSAVLIMGVLALFAYRTTRSLSSVPSRTVAYLVDKDVRILESNARGERQATKFADVFRIFDQRPDGSMLFGRKLDASRSTDTTFATALWLLRPNGRAEELVPNYVMEAKFVPGGNDVLYVTDEAELYRWSNGKSKKLQSKVSDLAVSQDGGAAAYIKLNADWSRGQYSDRALGLAKLDLLTGKETQLTNTWEDFGPSFSPDGSSLAFASGRAAGLASVWMMDADGKNQRQITNVGQVDYDPDKTLTAPGSPLLWTPDGRHLVYESDRKIWSLTLDDKKTKLSEAKQIGYGEQPVLIDDQTVGILTAPSSTTTPKITKVRLNGDVVE
ncbi:MAG: PD40 domain-containing protein [Candidatus Kerfeldbacteria bacterium]|nr:PD40 domain-containing protein [Candidatus Kerfeldbacteria bacterium]